MPLFVRAPPAQAVPLGSLQTENILGLKSGSGTRTPVLDREVSRSAERLFVRPPGVRAVARIEMLGKPLLWVLGRGSACRSGFASDKEKTASVGVLFEDFEARAASGQIA